MSLVFIPLNLIAMSIATVFFPKISGLKSIIEQRNKTVLSLYNKVFYIGVVGLILLSFVLNNFLVPILGIEWSGTGRLSSFMVISFAFYIVSVPLSVIYRVIGIERDNFKLSIGFSVAKIICLSIGVLYNDFYLLIFIYFLIELIKNASTIYHIFKRLKIKINFIIRDLTFVLIIYSLLFYLMKI
jgi:O-antigen/teichoic acid export membrane protein